MIASTTHPSQLLLDEPPARLVLFPDWFETLDLDSLARHISWRQNQIRLFGKLYDEPRLTCWYGPPYQYSGITWPAAQLPPVLSSLCDELSHHTGFSFNSVLCNYYRHGRDSMSWHSDDEPEMDQRCIASVSLGGERMFRYRKKASTSSQGILLTHGSVLIMQEFQSGWQHSIPKTTRNAEPRLNLTFRRILT